MLEYLTMGYSACSVTSNIMHNAVQNYYWSLNLFYCLGTVVKATGVYILAPSLVL
jgi:hypothetical protein